VFTDAEIDAFLALEGGSVKLAAAQAIDANATNEALASKVIKDHQLSTDGAKVADAMRKHATALRDQVAGYDDSGVFEVVDFSPCWPEGTEPPLRVLVMPRPRQAQGRPGTPVIPAAWGESHAGSSTGRRARLRGA
jgi:hypothetical protein